MPLVCAAITIDRGLLYVTNFLLTEETSNSMILSRFPSESSASIPILPLYQKELRENFQDDNEYVFFQLIAVSVIIFHQYNSDARFRTSLRPTNDDCGFPCRSGAPGRAAARTEAGNSRELSYDLPTAYRAGAGAVRA